MKIVKKKKTRILSMLLVVAMLAALVSGCGKANEAENSNAANQEDAAAQTSGDNAGSGGSASAQSTEPTAMGRYVEKVTDMSDKSLGYGNRLFGLDDGTLVITSEGDVPFYVSKDNGETWEEDDWTWHKRMLDEETYVGDAAIGSDGTVAVLYNIAEEGGYENALLIIKPDGTEIPVETPAEIEMYPHRVVVTDNGRVFVTFLGTDNLYEAMEDGSCKLFLTMQADDPKLMHSKGNLLIMDGYDYDAPLIYDLEKEEYIEDEVFIDFCKENYKNSYGSSWFEFCFFMGEEGVIYLAGSKGLHRHVIGGSAMEQVIDGSLSTFSNPAYGIGGMVMLPDNEFMAIFSSGRLVRFVYDPNISTVPNERLKVYSLNENDTVRQAISLYQTANPEVYMEYEIGIEEGSSVTREDALKSLNTKVMAGEGPDVLILDNMPLDSYIEKGLLLDLTSFIGSLGGEEELFGNIVDAMKTGDKLYAMPCEIQIPAMLGEEKYISLAKDLEGIADMVEALRKDNPGVDVLGFGLEKGILRFFSMSSVPAWTTENGDIDKAAITDFLKQTKRIYDAQYDGLSTERIEQFNRSEKYYLEEMGQSLTDSIYLRRNTRGLNYIGGFQQLVVSALSDRNDYMELLSVNRVDGFEDRVWALMNGQSENVFCTQTLMGINAASQYTAQAQDFIRLCLGKENQANLFYGFTVNKAAFDESFIPDAKQVTEDGVYFSEAMSNQDGMMVGWEVYWPEEKQISELKKCIETLDTAYIENAVIEGAVYEEGVAYLKGEQSLDKAVDAIEKKVALYLAE